MYFGRIYGKIYLELCNVHIGGHGFWDKGGVYTLGVSEKNSAAASGGVHRGVNFRKKLEF